MVIMCCALQDDWRQLDPFEGEGCSQRTRLWKGPEAYKNLISSRARREASVAAYKGQGNAGEDEVGK